VAEAHPMVLLDPAPVVMFMGFGADSMNFEIRAILRDVNWMLSAASDMNYAIVKSFREEGIEIPFAQRDVYIKNLDQLGGARSAEPKIDALEQGSAVPASASSSVAMDRSEGDD
jgi:potassium efflux system protein